MGRLHREQNPLCPEWGASTSPCVLKAGVETLCTPFPGGQENISGCVSPGVRSISLSDRPPPFSFSAFHSWNNRPGQFLWAPPHSLPKTKTVLNPDDQACSHFVWYVASAWGWGGGGRDACFQFMLGLPASRGAGAGAEKAPRSGEPRTTRFQDREQDHSSGSEASLGGTSQWILGQAQSHSPRHPSLFATLWTSDFPLYSIWLLLFFNEVRLKNPSAWACLPRFEGN